MQNFEQIYNGICAHSCYPRVELKYKVAIKDAAKEFDLSEDKIETKILRPRLIPSTRLLSTNTKY